MLAEHRGRAREVRPVVVHQDWIARDLHAAETRMLDLLHHIARDDLRMLEHLFEVVDAGAGHALLHQFGLDVGGDPLEDGGLDIGDEIVLVRLALGIGGEERIGDEMFELQRLHQLAEQHVVRRADGDVTLVLRLEQLVRRGEPVPVAHRLRHVSGFEIFRSLPGRRSNRRLDQRYVGDAAFAVAGRADEDRKSTRLNSSHVKRSRMPSSA